MDEPVDKPWDDSLRKLIRANPQAFVTWVLGKAQFVRGLPEKLKSWKLEVDSLLHVVLNEQEMLLHIEFQTYNDSSMAERLLRYNVLARSEYNLPVLSCVIYLLSDGNIPRSPLSWTVPTGQEVLLFSFENIELGELPPEEILQMKQPGLLPLLPLTKGGARREVVDTMFAELKAVGAGQTELMTIGSTLASLVFNRENAADLDWLHRRLHEMHDILRESPFYQEILREGREEGLEEGREEGLEEGLQKGKVEAMREMLLTIVRVRFPKLARLAKALAAITEDPEDLQNLILKISLAQSFEEAQQCLIEEGEKDSNQ
jgi:predicted transposase/invertase (TIGR01784 family)